MVAVAAVATVFVVVATAAVAWAGLPPGEVEISTPVYEVSTPEKRDSERFVFSFNWSGIPVGRVSMTVADSGSGPDRRLSLSTQGRTNAVVDLLWKYRMDFSGAVTLEPFAPSEFFSREQENRRHKTTSIKFSRGPEARIESVVTKGERRDEFSFAAGNTLDILSTVLLMLELDYFVGEQYYFDVLTGKSRYLVTAGVEARELIEVAGKTEDAYRLLIETSDLTDPGDDEKHRATHLWVSAARPRHLLRAASKTFIGSVYVELTAVEQP